LREPAANNLAAISADGAKAVVQVTKNDSNVVLLSEVPIIVDAVVNMDHY